MGVGLLTMSKWVIAHRDTEIVSDKDQKLAHENERRPRENRILKAEKEFSKGAKCQGSWDQWQIWTQPTWVIDRLGRRACRRRRFTSSHGVRPFKRLAMKTAFLWDRRPKKCMLSGKIAS